MKSEKATMMFSGNNYYVSFKNEVYCFDLDEREDAKEFLRKLNSEDIERG